jgi:hypothetical protein
MGIDLSQKACVVCSWALLDLLGLETKHQTVRVI